MRKETTRHRPELSVVMPVFNEAGSVRRVIPAWVHALDRLQVDYELLAYDDGSSDESLRLLNELAHAHPKLCVRSHENRGHGPTVLRGYREARGDWVFQVDSDGEMPADDFEGLWSERDDYDFLLGFRSGRQQNWARRLVTLASRGTVWMLFGNAVYDVNTPYRLMRRSALEKMLPEVPPNTFAPNVILSGIAARRGLRIAQYPVRHLGRVAGKASLGSIRLWKAAALCFFQTVAAALKP